MKSLKEHVRFVVGNVNAAAIEEIVAAEAVPYLLYTGLPALRKGASIAGRSASPPPLVAHVLVALTTDRHLAMAATHQFIDMNKLTILSNKITYSSNRYCSLCI